MWPWRSRLLALLGLFAALALFAGQEPPDRLSGPEVYQRTLRATAWVIPSNGSKGTGWLLDRGNRLLVTNYHVLGDSDAADVVFPALRDGKVIAERSWYTENLAALRESGHAVRARVVHRDKDCDLALLQLESVPNGVVELRLAAESPAPGDRVHSIGNRRDAEALWVGAAGVVRQVCRTREGYFWQGAQLAKGATVVVTQTPILEGDSGGPLVNDRGEVVAVVAAVRWQTHLATVAIDVSEVRAFVARAPVAAEPRSAKPAGKPQGGAEVCERLLRSAAWVRTASSGTRATGWVVDRGRRLLVTTSQAVGGAETVDLVFPVSRGGKVVAEYAWYRDALPMLRESGHVVRGTVLAHDAARNLAVVEAEALPDGVLDLPLAADGPVPGESVHVVSNPNGSEALWVYAAGAVRQVCRANLGQPGDQRDVRTVLAQLPLGDGGGPVVNDRGQLVAVVSGKDSPQQLVAYCTDVTEVRAFLAESRPRWEAQSADAFRQRAAQYVRTRQYDRGLADLAEAIRLDPKDASLLGERAEVHRLRGDPERALADCDAALQLDPRLASAYHRRAAVRSMQGDQDRAVAGCDAALRLDPQCAAAYAVRAEAFRLKGDAERALADLDRALALDPNLAAAYLSRSLLHAGRGEDGPAVADFTRAAEFDPLLASAYRHRGDAYRRKNEPKPALADYAQALELDPQDAHAHLGRGLVHSGRGEHDRAVADFTEAVRLQPGLAGDVLDEVARRGEALTDAAAACRLYLRALGALQPLLDSPDAQKAILDGIAAAGREPDLPRRARGLHALVAEVRIKPGP